MQIANKHWKSYSILLIIEKILFKTAVRYHYLLIRIAKIKLFLRVWKNLNSQQLISGE